MIDIHCHILPGMDDGADTIEESVEMAEMAIADGITHIVGTPHANSEYPFDPEVVMRRRDELQERVGNRLTLASGCDFHMSFENLQAIQKNQKVFTINQKNYLLVEFADFAIAPNMDDNLHQLLLAGLSPIITHPERNVILCKKQELLYKWLHLGCYVQVTAQSLMGRFGDTAQRRAEQWLEQDRVHFVASDAHNVKSRPLRLSPAYEAVAKKRGEAVAKALFHDNPLAAFEGRPLPYEPPQADPATIPPEYSKKKKRFFFF